MSTKPWPKVHERFTAYITKWALTKGILVMEVEATSHESMVATRMNNGGIETCFHGNDWHRTEAEARARVDKMIEAKRKSLQKQLAKLPTADSVKLVKNESVV